MFAQHLYRTALAAMLLALVACAAPAPGPEDAAPSAATLAWPAPPAEPRVVFVRSISSPKDLAFTKGFFTRLFEAFFGETQERIVRPMSVLQAGEVLYVGDPGAKGVHRFDRKAGRYSLLHAENDAPLLSPVGMALGESGVVYVADSALRAVFVIKPEADFAVRLQLDGELKQPTGIALDTATQRIFVSDTLAHQIKIFSTEGKALGSIGQRGDADGEFNFPTMLWRNQAGRLFVTDSLNFRTQMFDVGGKFLGKFGRMGDSGGDAPRQKGVATDRFGHVYIVDSLLNAVQIFNEAGQFLLSIGGLGQANGEFWLPSGIFIGADDLIYVADAYNQRVQVFRYVGGPT